MCKCSGAGRKNIGKSSKGTTGKKNHDEKSDTLVFPEDEGCLEDIFVLRQMSQEDTELRLVCVDLSKACDSVPRLKL